MWYFIIFGKTILMVLSPHSSNSDIHFVQDLLALGCQEKIKAGATRGSDFPEAGAARPRPHSNVHITQLGRRTAMWPPTQEFRGPLSAGREANLGAGTGRECGEKEVGMKAIATGPTWLCCEEVRAAERVPPQHGAYQLPCFNL